MFDIPSLDDPRVQVEIPVPVKDRKKPLLVRVPRFDFIGEDQHDEIRAAAEKIDQEHADLDLVRRQRLADLAALKLFVPEKDHAALDTLSSGQVRVVMMNWAQGSSIPLGELLASVASSTGSTEAPSFSTSTPEAGQGGTSGGV